MDVRHLAKKQFNGQDLKLDNQHFFNKKTGKEFLLCQKIKHKKLLNLEKWLVSKCSYMNLY